MPLTFWYAKKVGGNYPLPPYSDAHEMHIFNNSMVVIFAIYSKSLKMKCNPFYKYILHNIIIK